MVGSTVTSSPLSIFVPFNRAALGLSTWPRVTWSDGNTTGDLGEMKRKHTGIGVRLKQGQVMVLELSP